MVAGWGGVPVGWERCFFRSSMKWVGLDILFTLSEKLPSPLLNKTLSSTASGEWGLEKRDNVVQLGHLSIQRFQ
jgi:hypothetical protein